MKDYKKIGLIGLISLISLVGLINIHAQTAPQFLISWQANSTAPSWYQGKIFPIKDSQVDIGFELIDNGKPADLSKTAIRWYINDKLVKNEKDGLGIKYLKFIVADYPGQKTEIRIAIPSYKNFDPLDKIIAVPVVQPEAVISAIYPNKEITAGKSEFEAIPFFFSAQNSNQISYRWFVDNREVSDLGENFNVLDLNIPLEAPKGTVISIKTTIKNLFKDMEFASKSIRVSIK